MWGNLVATIVSFFIRSHEKAFELVSPYMVVCSMHCYLATCGSSQLPIATRENINNCMCKLASHMASRAYDNGQSQNIFQPKWPFVWPNQIWPDKFTNGKRTEFTKMNVRTIFSPYHEHWS